MIFTHLSARKVMVEDGLVHRFMTVIGHHRPGARRQSRGIVSPVKKLGSPPPNGFIVSVGQFQNRIGDIRGSAVRIEFDTYPTTVGGVESQEQIVRIIGDGGISDSLVAAWIETIHRERLRIFVVFRPEEAGEYECRVFRHGEVEAITAIFAIDAQLLGVGVI